MLMEHIIARNKIMQKYGYDMMVNGSDYNLIIRKNRKIKRIANF